MSETCTPPRKISKRWYTQNFKEEWLKDPELKDWLREDSKEKRVCYCICCDVKLKNANKSMLIAHKNTAKHKKCASVSKASTKLDTFFTKLKTAESEEIAKAELTIAVLSSMKDPDNLEINGEPNAEAIFISVPPAETSGSVSLEASSCESPLKNRNSVTFQPIKTVTVPSGKISEYHGSIRAEDEFDLFGKSMASHLRKMPLLAALECQSKIQSYIIQKRIEITSSSDVSIKQGQ